MIKVLKYFSVLIQLEKHKAQYKRTWEMEKKNKGGKGKNPIKNFSDFEKIGWQIFFKIIAILPWSIS